MAQTAQQTVLAWVRAALHADDAPVDDSASSLCASGCAPLVHVQGEGCAAVLKAVASAVEKSRHVRFVDVPLGGEDDVLLFLCALFALYNPAHPLSAEFCRMHRRREAKRGIDRVATLGRRAARGHRPAAADIFSPPSELAAAPDRVAPTPSTRAGDADPWASLQSAPQTPQPSTTSTPHDSGAPDEDDANDAGDDPWAALGGGERAELAALAAPRASLRRAELNSRGLRGEAALAALLPAGAAGFAGLVELDLSGNALASVPAGVGALPALEVLDVCCNAIAALRPGDLPPTLRVLAMTRNCARELPECVFRLPRLRELRAGSNELERLCIPEDAQAAGLERLCVARNQLRAIPAGVWSLRGLREVDASHNALAGLPERLGELQALEELEVSCNRISVFPASMARLRRLRRLNATSNALRAVPDEWAAPGAFGALADLMLRDNRLEELPEGLLSTGGLAATLEMLEVSDNRLRRLPDLSGAAALAGLFAGGNALAEPPRGLRPERLVCLDLSRNKLREFPDLAGAQGLRLLALGHNRARALGAAVPPSVVELYVSGLGLRELPGPAPAGLEALLASGNRLADVGPEWLAHAKLADLAGNPLAAPERLAEGRGAWDVVFDAGGPLAALTAPAGALATGAAAAFAFTKGRRDYMEDCACAAADLLGDGTADLLCVLDGHGGPHVALWGAQELPGALRGALAPGASAAEARKALAAAFRRANRAVRLKAAALPEMEGSTALALLLTRAGEGGALTLHVANAGDTRAVLCRDGKARRVSVDHRPLTADEYARISARGGYVSERGEIQGMLTVSRGLGDYELRPFVTDEAHCESHAVGEGDEFVVMASDGLWDTVTDEMCVRVVRKALKRSPGNARAAAEVLRDWAYLGGSGDNITVGVVVLPH
eukprot:m51a1_g7064 putative protein phosphatase 2c (900) ;mRNA; f:181236-184380